jgi:hypothetical protein
MSNTTEKSIYNFEKLQGTENYVIWSMRIKALLTRDKVCNLVIGKRVRPQNPEVDYAEPGSSPNIACEQDPVAAKTYTDQVKWDEDCSLAESHIISALSNDVMTSVKEESAPQMWTSLKETYGKQTSSSLHSLKAPLDNTKL